MTVSGDADPARRNASGECCGVDLGDRQRTPVELVGHDRSGSGWFLDKVVIKEARNAKREYVFPCDQ